MRQLDIGEAVRRSGVSASILRYYEEKGSIASSGRHGLRRLFDIGVLEQLALIGLGRAVGLPLDEIAGMGVTDGALRIDRAALTTKADELDRMIRRLVAMRDDLWYVAACPAHEHTDYPTLRRLLRAVAAGATRPCRKAPGAQQNGRQVGHPCPACRPRGMPSRRAGTATAQTLLRS